MRQWIAEVCKSMRARTPSDVRTTKSDDALREKTWTVRPRPRRCQLVGDVDADDATIDGSNVSRERITAMADDIFGCLRDGDGWSLLRGDDDFN